MVNLGFAVRVLGGTVGPGCVDAGSGVAVPKVEERYDYPALAQCLAGARRQIAAEGFDPSGAAISANPGTPFGQVACAMKTLDEAGFTMQTFKIVR